MSDRRDLFFVLFFLRGSKCCLSCKSVCDAVLVVLPFTSASSSLVFNLSIFSFQSLESSFSMHEDSKKLRIQRTYEVICIIFLI